MSTQNMVYYTAKYYSAVTVNEVLKTFHNMYKPWKHAQTVKEVSKIDEFRDRK